MKQGQIHYLNALKVAGIICVSIFHCGIPFGPGYFPIKNKESIGFVTSVTRLIVLFGMPLFFIISGWATFLMRSRYSIGKLLKKRFIRLGIPLVFAIFVLSPPQIYIQRLQEGQFTGSFIQFFPRYFDGFLGYGGNFAWMGLHLWYVFFLLIYTFFLPIWVSANPKSKLRWGHSLLSCLWVLPLLYGFEHLRGLWKLPSPGSWGILTYLPFLFAGYHLNVREGFQWPKKEKILLVCLAVLFCGAYMTVPLDEPYLGFFRITGGWFSILTLFMFFKLKYNSENPIIKRLSPLILPFYVIHQPVIVLVGYPILESSIPVVAKYLSLLFLGLGLSALTTYFYEQWKIKSIPIRA